VQSADAVIDEDTQGKMPTPDSVLFTDAALAALLLFSHGVATGATRSLDVVLLTNAVVSVNATLFSDTEAGFRAVRLSHATSGVCPSRQWYKTLLLATMRSAPGEASCWVEPTVAPMHVPAHTSVAPNVSAYVVIFASCVDP
jgi:hypothetical protein